MIQFFSCSQFENSKGNISIDISKLSSRVILPEECYLEISYFKIVGIGPLGHTFEKNLSHEDSDIEISNIKAGDWNIQVFAYNGNDSLIFKGENLCTVYAGETTSISIQLLPVDGFGSLDLEVEWNTKDILEPGIRASLELNGTNEILDLDFVIDDEDERSKANCELDSISSGYHILKLQLLDSGIVSRGTVELVRIVSNVETEGDIDFSLVNKIGGGSGEIPDPIDIFLSGTKEVLFPGEVMNVTASTKEEDVVFLWYLDGERLKSGSTFSVSSDDISSGFHNMSVVAYNLYGTRVGIAHHSFRNLPYTPPSSWQHIYGGFNFDKAYKIVQTNDGGYLIAGTSNSCDIEGVENKGGFDAYIIKINYLGEVIWQKMIGGESEDIFTGLTIGHNDDYILCGTTNSSNFQDLERYGSVDSFVISLDSEGNVNWSKMYGTELFDIVYTIENIGNNNYLFTGRSGCNSFTGLIDKNGNTLWTKVYGGNGIDITNSVLVINNEIFTSGHSTSTNLDTANLGCSDFYLSKLDYNGNVLWQKLIGGSSYEQSFSMSKSSDGNIVLAGSTSTSIINSYPGYITGFSDVYIAKITLDGDLVWSNRFGGSNGDVARSIKSTSDGGFIVAGYTLSKDLKRATNNGWFDSYLLKLDYSGSLEWQRVFGGTSEDRSFDVIETSDKGYAVAGYTYPPGIGEYIGCYDFYVIKLNSQGLIDD